MVRRNKAKTRGNDCGQTGIVLRWWGGEGREGERAQVHKAKGAENEIEEIPISHN